MSDKTEKKIKLAVDEPQQGAIGGALTLDEHVIETIAGLAARKIKGINRLGKARLIGFGDDPKRGVSAEVGLTQAALDLELVIDYGVDIRKVAAELRLAIADEVGKMAGRDVVELNLHVIGICLPEQAAPVVEPERARVM